MASGGTAASSFSAESPPFNPHPGVGGGVGGGHYNLQGMQQQQQQLYHRNTPPRTTATQYRAQSGGSYLSSNNNNNNHNNGGNGSMHARSRSNSPHPSSHHHSHHPHSSFSNHTNTNNNNNNIPNVNALAISASSTHSSSNAISKFTFEYQGQNLELRNVWAENVEEEMACIREVVQKYPYVAMDTEFPGVVAKPVTETYSPDYHYRSLKVNVDLLKIIQLGLSFADEEGNFAPGCPCWQFNFKFDLDGDMFAQDSIDLLQKSGISFYDHAKRGIDPHVFGELLMVSGLVLDDRVNWVSFHSGYDYGYLLKLLTTTDLPSDEKTFLELLRLYFPTIYDIKYMTSILDGHFMGGLQRLADDLGCQRYGAEHQAGSDSLLTMSTFFALVRAKFTASSSDGKRDTSKVVNELYGYGTNHTVRKNTMMIQQREATVGGSGGGSSD